MNNKIFYRHDTKARNDEKIIALERKVGRWRGYALFMQTLELSAHAEDYKISEEKIDIYAYDLHISHKEYKKFLDACVEVGLLMYEENQYYSPRFVEEMRHIDKCSNKNRDNANKRWHGEQEEIDLQEPEPEKPKEKPKENPGKCTKEQIQAVFDYWNDSDIVKHEVFPDEMKHQIKRRVNEYGFDRVIESIKRYADAVHHDSFWIGRKSSWTLTTFLKQSNGMPTFLTWTLGNTTNKVYKQKGKKYGIGKG